MLPDQISEVNESPVHAFLPEPLLGNTDIAHVGVVIGTCDLRQVNESPVHDFFFLTPLLGNSDHVHVGSGLVYLQALKACPVLIGQLVVMAHSPSLGDFYALHVIAVYLSVKYTQSRNAYHQQLTSDWFLATRQASDLLVARVDHSQKALPCSQHPDLLPGTEWEGGCLVPRRLHPPRNVPVCTAGCMVLARMDALMCMETSLLVETLAVTTVGDEPWANNALKAQKEEHTVLTKRIEKEVTTVTMIGDSYSIVLQSAPEDREVTEALLEIHGDGDFPGCHGVNPEPMAANSCSIDLQSAPEDSSSQRLCYQHCENEKTTAPLDAMRAQSMVE
ncbi:hypothetical protein I79_022865 [Cricetulus griseus]|uniref:Uncharacterized protein n=1 Tax=Cricetulus griseus TaxID=10029 RepID=G3IGF3_CRIGR|nr:hypothetical protein I79_022865 [Cricetulus griseus]